MLCHAKRACDTAIPFTDSAQRTRADATPCCDAANTPQGAFTDALALDDPAGALHAVSEPRADITERRLLAAISKGSRLALRRLHSLYCSRLANFFMLLVPMPAAEIIDNLVADTMFDVWRTSANLGRGPSAHVAIMRIAWKHGSKHLACGAVHPSFPEGCSTRAESKTWSSTGTEALRPLAGVLATLHVNERAVVQLVHSGHSRQEVADILSVPCDAIDAYLASAMIVLHPWLAAKYSSTPGN